jgi:hypothetical protein
MENHHHDAVLILLFLNAILDLDLLIQDSEVEFIASVGRRRIDIIQMFPQVQARINVTSIIRPLAGMITSMETYQQFHQGWEQCRDALHSAVLNCPALMEYRLMFLPDEGCIAMIDAVNGMIELVQVVGNSEDLFDRYKLQCLQNLTGAYDRMEDDGHDMRVIELSYTRCLASLESYAAFIEGAVASHAGIVAAVRNLQVFAPFLRDLQPVMLVV